MDVQHWIDWVKNEWYSEKYGRVFNDEEKIKKFAEGAVSVYKTYYKDKHPIVYVNDGSAQTVINANAAGLDEDGKTVLDKVFIILKDNDGNYYAPMIIDVPNFF